MMMATATDDLPCAPDLTTCRAELAEHHGPLTIRARDRETGEPFEAPALTPTPLLDNSAWVRLGDAKLPAWRADEIADRIESGHIAACLPFLLEAGYSASTAREQDQLLAELRSLPHT